MEEQKRNPAQGLSESEQVQVRRQKLADLQAAGNDPFTLTKFPQDAYSADLKEEFKDLPNETDSGKQVALAGRMMSKRCLLYTSTLPILIAQLRSADFLKFDMGKVYMLVAIAILPVIIVYLLLSKFIVRGVALGGVKG